MTHKNGKPLLQGEDTACSRRSIRKRGERILYGSHVQTEFLQLRNHVDPTGCAMTAARSSAPTQLRRYSSL
jgi:hypothetical protein